MPAGRPTEYDPKYCEVVIALGKEGKSFAQMCAALMVSPQCFSEWRGKHEEFGEACLLAGVLSQDWWEKVGQDHIVERKDGDKVNAGLYGRSMSARFPNDWREKTAIVGGNEGDSPVSVASAGGEIPLEIKNALSFIIDKLKTSN